MGEKLKPCPLCGSGLRIYIYRPQFDDLGPSAWWRAACGDCGAHTGFARTREDAATLWNRRDYSHIEVTDAMVEAASKAILFEDCGNTTDWQENIYLGKAALTAALNVKEG